MIRAAAIAAVALALACGPSTKPTNGSVPDPDPAPDPTPAADAGHTADPATPDAGAGAATPSPDPRARCEALVDHMLDVALSEYPEDRHDAIREQMAADRDRLVDECTAGEVTEAEYDCAMAATTAADMEKCVP